MSAFGVFLSVTVCVLHIILFYVYKYKVMKNLQ